MVEGEVKDNGISCSCAQENVEDRQNDHIQQTVSDSFTKFKAARSKGYCVDFNWLWSKARVTKRELTDNANTTVRKHVVVSFLKRYNVRMRARQRGMKLARQTLEPELKKWHAITREKSVRTGKKDGYDQKWGRFK